MRGDITERDSDIKKSRRPYAARVDVKDLRRQLCLAAAAVAPRGAAPQLCADTLGAAASSRDTGTTATMVNHTDLVKVAGYGYITREECAALGTRVCHQKPECGQSGGRSCTPDDSWVWQDISNFRGQLNGKVMLGSR